MLWFVNIMTAIYSVTSSIPSQRDSTAWAGCRGPSISSARLRELVKAGNKCFDTPSPFAGTCPSTFLPIMPNRISPIVSTCSMALLFYAAKVSTLFLYVFNLVGILVAFLSRSATKIILLIIRICVHDRSRSDFPLTEWKISGNSL